MMRILSVMFTAMLFVALAVQAQDKKKDDHKRILGKWQLVEQHVNGRVRKDRELTMQISATEIIFKFGDRQPFKAKYKLDPSQTPKHIDQRVGSGSRKCVYSLDGNTLKICGTPPGGERPPAIESKNGDRNIVRVYKRVNEKEEKK